MQSFVELKAKGLMANAHASFIEAGAGKTARGILEGSATPPPPEKKKHKKAPTLLGNN